MNMNHPDVAYYIEKWRAVVSKGFHITVKRLLCGMAQQNGSNQS